MVNITGDGNFTSKLDTVFKELPAGSVKYFLALNIFLSITASLGNALILIAIHKVSSIYPPTKLFFRCMAVTDLVVGVIVQPLYQTFLLSRITYVNDDVVFYVSELYNVFSWILCGVSLLTSTAISVDRLLALWLGLRYRHVVTLRRVRVSIISFWLMSASFGSIRMSGSDIIFTLAAIIVPLCLTTSIFCYMKIYLRVRHQQVRVQDHVSQGQANGGDIPLNILRYKKFVSSISWVQLALVACYVPFGIVLVLYVDGIKNDVAWVATLTLVYFNSSLNPILYCWKIREVRQAVKNILRQLL